MKLNSIDIGDTSLNKEGEKVHMTKGDFSNWVIKSKHQKYYFLVVPFSLFFVFTCLNYFYLNGLRYVFPPVDVVDILARSDDIPSYSFDNVYGQTFRFDNKLLTEILKDIYILRETEYLDSKEFATISIEPEILWSTHSIALILREGLFNFSTNSISRDNIAVSHMISRSTYPSGNYFDLKWGSAETDLEQNFIRQFLYSIFYIPPIPPSDYNVDALIVHFFLGRVSNCGILASAVTTLISLLLFECFPNIEYAWIIHFVNYIILMLSAVNCLIHSMIKLVVTVMIDYRFPTLKYHFSCLLILLQILSYSFIYSKYHFKYSRRSRALQESRAMKKLMLKFEPSPSNSFQSSSIYSRNSEQVKSISDSSPMDDNAELKKSTDYSAMSLDPLKNDLSLEGFNFSPDQGSKTLPKTGTYHKESIVSPPARNHTAPILYTNLFDQRADLVRIEELKEARSPDQFESHQSSLDEVKIKNGCGPGSVNPYSTPTSYVASDMKDARQKASSIFAEEEDIS